MGSEYPLRLTIKAIDKATEPLRKINAQMQAFTAPMRRLSNAFRALSQEAGIPRLVNGFSRVGKSVWGAGKEASALALRLGALTSAAAYGFHRIVRGAVDAGDKLGEMAARVGLSVDAYARLQYAAAQADVEQEQFSASMDQLNKRLGEAKAGGGPLLSFLNQVAPALAAQMKGASGTGEALKLLAGAFEKVTDPAKRAALTAAAFGKGGVQMGQFLGQGTAAIEAYEAEFARLAGSQEEFARGAGELDNSMRRTGVAFAGTSNAMVGAMFPALTKLSAALTEFIGKNRDGLVKWAEKVGAAISGWVESGGVEKLGATLKSIADAVGTVAGALGSFHNVMALVAGFMAGKLLVSLLMAVKSLGLLTGVLAATPIGWFLAGIAAIAAAVYLVVRHWEPIKKFFTDLWASVVGIFTRAWDKVKPIIDGIKGVSSGISNGFRGDNLTEYGSDNQDFGSAGAAAGAAGALPPALAGRGGDAHVTIDVQAPRGTRVTPDPHSTADLDLSVGYSMSW